MFIDLIVKKVCAIEGPVLYPYKNKEICVALFHIRIFLCLHNNFHYFVLPQHVAHMQVHGSYVCRNGSGLLRLNKCDPFSTLDLTLIWHENL